MSIFVTGDVHGVAEYGASRFSSRVWPLGRTLTRDDVVIVAGDFGFIWSGSNTDKYWLDWFESKPWTTCFVDGNHENYHLLAGLPIREWNGGLVHEARPHVLHLMQIDMNYSPWVAPRAMTNSGAGRERRGGPRKCRVRARWNTVAPRSIVWAGRSTML